MIPARILTGTENSCGCPPPTLDESLTNIRSIKGRAVALRPINRPDFPTLYNWRSQLAIVPTWSTQYRRIVRFEEFVTEADAMLRDAIAMMALDLETGQPAG